MSTWDIRFPKEMQVKAVARKCELVAVGYVGAGRAEVLMYLDSERTTFLWRFAHEMNGGKSPEEAFEATRAAIAAADAERTAKATAAESPS